jgi:hypothetical protein
MSEGLWLRRITRTNAVRDQRLAANLLIRAYFSVGQT